MADTYEITPDQQSAWNTLNAALETIPGPIAAEFVLTLTTFAMAEWKYTPADALALAQKSLKEHDMYLKLFVAGGAYAMNL